MDTPDSLIGQGAGIAQVLADSVVDQAMYLLDLDGIVRSWNPGAQRISGYTAQEIIGSNFSVFYTDDDKRAGEPLRALESARANGSYLAEGWRVCKDGMRLWASIVIDVVRNPAGEVVGYAKATRDITQIAVARSVRQQNEDTAQLLIDSVVDYAIYLLDLDGTVKTWNPGAQRIKGYSPQEIIGSHFSLFYTDEAIAAGEPARSLGTARSTGTFATEGWRVRKDGTRLWASVVIDAVRNPMGEVVGFAKITRDLTVHAALPRVSDDSGAIAQLLIESVVDHAILLLDLDGTVKSWNPGAQRIYGYGAREIIGSNFAILFSGDDARAGEPERLLAAARGRQCESDGWRIRKDGSRLFASVTINAVHDAAGDIVGFVNLTRDVTQRILERAALDEQREKSEEQLRASASQLSESNRRMALAEQMAHVAHWRIDLLANTFSWSDELYRIVGRPFSVPPDLENTIGSLHPSDRQRVRAIVEQTIRDGIPLSFETRIAHADGTYRDVICRAQAERAEDGSIIGVTGVLQDVSERKADQRERERLAARVGHATQAAQVGIWDWDFATNALTWDPTMFALYGFKDAAFSPAYEVWAGALYGDDRERAEREIAHAASSGEPFKTEFRIVWPDGEVHHLQATATVVCDEAGAAQGMIGTNWDITEVRALAEKLRFAADRDRATAVQVVETNRLMAMAEQMAHIAHWRIDGATNELIWSDELYAILGWPKSSPPVLESVIASYHPDDRSSVRESVGRALHDGTPMAYAARIARADGSYRDVICSGQAERAEDGAITGIVGIFQDITERKEAERERERLTLRVGLATQSARVGIWDWDMEANSILCDPIMHTLYGFDEADFFPGFQTWIAAVHADDRERVAQELTHAASSHVPFASEFKIVWPNAEVHHIRATATVTYSRAGIAERMIGTNWDVTEVRTLNAQLQHEKDVQQRLTERVNLATSAAQVGIWEWNIRTGAVEWDRIMYRLFGVDPAEGPATYQTWATALHADDRVRVEGELAQAAANAAMFDSEFRIVWPGDYVRNIRAAAVIVRDAAGAAERMIGTNWDVTEARTLAVQLSAVAERDRATAATLQEKNRLLAMAEEMSHVGNWRLDLKSSKLFWSDELYRTFDLPKTFQPTFESVIRAYHPDDRESVSTALEYAIATKSPDRNESRIVRPDGSIRHVISIAQPEFDADGSVIAVAGAFQDVTEARAAERERLKLLERVRTAAQAGKVGIWEWDLLTDGVVWDSTMFALYGLSERAEPQTAELWKRAFHPDDEQHATRAIVDALHGRSLLDVEYRVCWPNGEIHHLRCRGMVQAAETGKPLHMLGTAWDVTEVRALALQLLEEKGRLLETVDMWIAAKQVAEDATRAKSSFLANMSHEIRSPMNAILGMLQLLQTEGLSARQADYAAKACVATRALLRVLNDILDFSKIEAGRLTFEKAPFDIDAMMGDVSTLLSASIGAKPVEFVFVNDIRLPKRLQGDAFRLRQVLLNLAGNAIKFTAQGEILIELRQIAQGPDRCEIEFAVTDTGIGIAPEQLTAIFEGFNQGESSTTRRYGGTGLGLAISARIVSLMGGQLNVESAVDAGSRFHFTLTFDRADEPIVPDSPRRPKLPSTRCEHVLIIDDNEHARTVSRNIVASFGWTGDCVGAGREALELIGRADPGREYGLVLVDWMMPELDGWETSRRIRELLPVDDVRIVLMASAHDLVQLSARMESDPHVVDALLAKPFTASSLLNSLLEPRSPGDAVGVLQPGPASGRRLDALNVLVVDDFAINLEIAGELLALEGAYVELAGCAQEAIDKVLRFDPPFDVVLMDVQMPETDGYETTRRLRELPGMAAIPIIAMTANAMDTDKAACLAAGMDDHIPKPIDIAVVVDTILEHCRPSGAVGIDPVCDTAETTPNRPGMLPIEVDAALERLGNNHQLFATLAGRFIEKSDAFIVELRSALHNGAITDAMKLLHQLKGFAGTVGNVVLAALASRLETELKVTGCLADPGTDLVQLAVLVEAGNAALTKISRSFGMAAPIPGIAPELDNKTIEAMLEEIDGLLAAANMRAVSRCSELVRSMDATGARRLAGLVQAIDRLDFPQARAEVTRLLPAFDRTPGNRGVN